MRVYMDNGATTRVTEPVMAAMQPYFCEIFGNPSSVHGFGREARKAVDAARAQVAKAINAEPREIYFTGCGTESDNLAIIGGALAAQMRGKHLITTQIEHPAVLEAMKYLESQGFEVTRLGVDRDGLVSPDQVAAAVRPDTILVSVMHTNNEIGAVEPVAEIGRAVKAANPQTCWRPAGTRSTAPRGRACSMWRTASVWSPSCTGAASRAACGPGPRTSPGSPAWPWPRRCSAGTWTGTAGSSSP